MGRVKRALGALRGRTKALTSTEIFLRADRARREGRLDEAARLVASGLEQNPKHAAGHLIAAYIHMAQRRLDAAKAAFDRVLEIEPNHPRACLGLGRVALDEGDFATSRRHLEHAIQLFPDFPEARALLDVVASRLAEAVTTRAPSAAPTVQPDRVRTAAGTRDTVLARADGSVVFAQLGAGRAEELATVLARAAHIANATLARAGLGASRRGVIDVRGKMLVLRSDADLILAVAFPTAAQPGEALLEANRVWTAVAPEAGGSA
jgi:tetratricopeptide (TPR) repeat protein